jgi:hypothetical protein
MEGALGRIDFKECGFYGLVSVIIDEENQSENEEETE